MGVVVMYNRAEIIRYLEKLYNTKLDDYLLIPKPMVKRIIEILKAEEKKRI